MEQTTDAGNEWLRETDASIDWLCRELSDWLTEYLHRPEMLVTLTLAMGGSQQPPSEDAPFKHWAEALATLLKKGYRDSRFIFPVVRHLKQRRFDSIRASLWTTGNLPGPTHVPKTRPRSLSPPGPLSPIDSLPRNEDIIQWKEQCEDGQAPEYTEEDGSRSGTPFSFHIPEHVIQMREKEEKRQEQEEFERGQKILWEQRVFREQEKCREPERLQELARLQERLHELESVREATLLPSEAPPLATATQRALGKHLRHHPSKRLRQSKTSPLNHTQNNRSKATSSKVTKANKIRDVKRAPRQRTVEPPDPHPRRSDRIKAQCLDKELAARR